MQKLSRITPLPGRSDVSIPLRQRNCNAILNAIFRAQPVSRSGLCDLTGLTPATVSSLTQTLVGAGIARFNGEGSSIGGRKPMLMDLNPSAFYVAAVDLGITKMIVAIVDLSGNIVRSERSAIDINAGPEPIIDKMILSLKSIRENVDKEISRKTLAIGLSLPGAVDIKEGLALHNPGSHSISQEEDIPIANILSQEFSLPTFIENNARAMALGEVRYGTAKGHRNVFCVNVGHGIGSGLIIEGELYRGDALPTSGLGHLMILPSGPICYCGGRGCVEALASGYAIAATAMRSFNVAEGAMIRKLAGGRGEKVTAEIVFQAAKTGDRIATQILKEAASYLGMGISSLISLIRPDLIVLGGGVTKSGDLLLNEIVRVANMHSESKRITIPRIVLSTLKDYSSLVGAAAIAFQEMLSSKGFKLPR